VLALTAATPHAKLRNQHATARRRAPEEAARVEAGMLVVGDRRLPGIGRVLGSVANSVAHNAPVTSTSPTPTTLTNLLWQDPRRLR
jgi:nucleotide-binding universal stress UspA family protein